MSCVQSQMKFNLFSPLARALIDVGYIIALVLLAATVYEHVESLSGFRWSDVHNPPDSIPAYTGRLSATEQAQTRMFQSFEYYVINHGYIKILVFAPFVLLLCSEMYSNLMYSTLGVMCILWCVTELIAFTFLYPAYLDCKNFWYCRLYNDEAPAVEFINLLIVTGASFFMSAGILVWGVATRFEINSLKSREFALLGKI